MMPSGHYLPLVLLLLAGCAAPHQGIRFRAQAPPIDDGFRKITLALRTDGYRIDDLDPANHSLATDWRELKPQELSESDARLPAGSVQGAVSVRLEQRGLLYEVYSTPSLRYQAGNAWRETVAGVNHPFWTRWNTLLTRLIEREARDGD